MSTKRIKLYNATDVKSAQEETKKLGKYFTRKTSKRRTIQVRISGRWHQKIKDIAAEEKIMISFFLDRICEHFFKHYK